MVVASEDSEDSPKHEKKIDSFVDKLENLMLARSRQYEERKELAKEMTERQMARLAERTKAKEVETESLLKEGADTSTEDPTKELEEDVSNHAEGNENGDITKVSENKNELKSCEIGVLLSIDANGQEGENVEDDEHAERYDNGNDSESCKADILLPINDNNDQETENDSDALLNLSMPEDKQTCTSAVEDKTPASEDEGTDESVNMPSPTKSQINEVASCEVDSSENQPPIGIPDAFDTPQLADSDAPVVDNSPKTSIQIEAKDFTITNEVMLVLDKNITPGLGDTLDDIGSIGSQGSAVSADGRTLTIQESTLFGVEDDLADLKIEVTHEQAVKSTLLNEASVI